MELAPVSTISFPSRWTTGKLTPVTSAQEIDKLARILVSGCEALSGVYMRLCDTIRQSTLPEADIRFALAKHFPQPRVSEIIRVARAPENVYARYTAGFFGFRAALKQCRAYNLTPSQELTRRQAKRAAARLIALMGQGEVRVRDSLVTISKA